MSTAPSYTTQQDVAEPRIANDLSAAFESVNESRRRLSLLLERLRGTKIEPIEPGKSAEASRVGEAPNLMRRADRLRQAAADINTALDEIEKLV